MDAMENDAIKNMMLFQEKLSKPIQLPSLAKNIQVLMGSLADDSMNYHQLAKVIKYYPDITARLIFLANSPWSAPVSPISSIEQACSRLGISVVKSVSLAMSIASSFDTRKCPSFIGVDFWTEVIMVAEGAGLLASKLPINKANLEFQYTAQTAGIMHKLGMLWLADNFNVETDKAIKMSMNKEISLSLNDSLRECLGIDYCEVGGWIAKQLNFPEALQITMEHHLNEDYQNGDWEVSALVGSASIMISALEQKAEVVPVSPRLELLGLDLSVQNNIFQQLSRNVENNRKLAKTLFDGLG